MCHAHASVDEGIEKNNLGTIWYFPFALGILHFSKIIQWMCITFMKAMWWLVYIYIYIFASCAKGINRGLNYNNCEEVQWTYCKKKLY